MITLFQHFDGVTVLVANVLAFFDPATTVAAFDPKNLITKIQDFLLPLVLLAVGAISIKFLMQRQMTQFFQFAAIAILVLVLIIEPGVMEALATWASKLFT